MGIYPVTLGSVLPHKSMPYRLNSKNVGLIRSGSRRWDGHLNHFMCESHVMWIPSYHQFYWSNLLKSHPPSPFQKSPWLNKHAATFPHVESWNPQSSPVKFSVRISMKSSFFDGSKIPIFASSATRRSNCPVPKVSPMASSTWWHGDVDMEYTEKIVNTKIRKIESRKINKN